MNIDKFKRIMSNADKAIMDTAFVNPTALNNMVRFKIHKFIQDMRTQYRIFFIIIAILSVFLIIYSPYRSTWDYWVGLIILVCVTFSEFFRYTTINKITSFNVITASSDIIESKLQKLDRHFISNLTPFTYFMTIPVFMMGAILIAKFYILLNYSFLFIATVILLVIYQNYEKKKLRKLKSFLKKLKFS
ncbi:MAG: hypothetical protein LUF90_10855 [Rikenellaceae bacterium]|nr:hypothetical protein [Rikenellaceae bacterium]